MVRLWIGIGLIVLFATGLYLFTTLNMAQEKQGGFTIKHITIDGTECIVANNSFSMGLSCNWDKKVT